MFLALFLAGCASNAGRIDALAGTLGMSRSVLEAGGFRSLVYMRSAGGPQDARLAIFIEGDGVPWRGGMQPSLDPTTGNPLALKLLAQTPGTAAYVSRPCYQEMTGPRCTPERWTMQRYSEEIVSSMTEAVRTTARRANAQKVRLVGYSGGGVLAVLIAERLDNVAAVITVGANLDTDAWTRHHGYLPLSGSLNPALEHGRASLAGDTFIWGARQRRADSHDRRLLRALPARAAQGHGRLRSRVLLGGAVAEAVARNGDILHFSRALSAASGKSENTPSMPSA